MRRHFRHQFQLERALRRNRRREFLAAAVLTGLVGLAACSSIPDAINPARLFDGGVQTAQAEPPPGSDEDYPKLGSVPAEKRPSASASDLGKVGEGLVADRDKAQYTNEAIRARSSDDVDFGGSDKSAPASTESANNGAEPGKAQPAEPPAAEASPAQQEANAPAVAAKPQPSKKAVATVTKPKALAARPANKRIDTIKDFREAFDAVFNEAYDPATHGVNFDYSRPRQPLAPAAAAAPEAADAGVPTTTPPKAAKVSVKVPQAKKKAAARNAPMQLASNGEITADGRVSSLATSVHFGTGSANLSNKAKAALRKVMEQYQQSGGAIRIVGHAGTTGSKQSVKSELANFNLSVDRANAVALELQRLGAPTAALVVVAAADGRADAGTPRADVFIQY